MITTRIACALALLAPTLTAGEMPVGFKGKTYSTRALPAELSPIQKDAVTRVTAWAEVAEYRMDFDAQGRILLLSPKGRSRLSDTLRTIAKTETWFDTVLPLPPRAQPKAATPASSGNEPKAGGTPPPRPPTPPIPEDPEGRPRQGVLAPEGPDTRGLTTWSSSWGTGTMEPDSVTAVLVIARNAEDYATLLDVLAKEREYLRDWLDVARKHTGFTVEDPLTGAFIENAAGQEEWSAEHEIINRVAQLLTLRRFGQQPNWVVQGIAWEAEMHEDGQVWCFPYRREFVFAAEHGAWPGDAKNLVKELEGKPVDLAPLCAWKRGAWDPKAAKLAWGVTRHFLGQAPGRFSAALEELRVLRDEANRRSTGPGSWERIPGWEMPAEMMAGVLERRFGKSVMVDATTSIRTGKVVVVKEAKMQGKVGSLGR